MSPRAAWRLESLGFTRVFDYVAGKADWFASGLPIEGKLAAVPRIGAVARRDVPVCALSDRIGDVRQRAQEAGCEACAVVNEECIVLGLLRRKELEADPEATAEQVMRPGPTTFRPNVPVKELAERMRERGALTVLVTTSDGKLVGQLRRDDAERVAAEGARSGAVGA
jgi:CBS domain-containing protein